MSSSEATATRDASVPFAASDAPVAPARVAERETARSGRGGGATARAVLRAARPRQWSKNVLVAAAPCAAGAIAKPEIALRTGLAFIVFCLLSSATYLLNDVRDAEQDRLHPRKRRRPVAAGELSERVALAAAATMAIAGLAIAYALAPLLAAVGVGYMAITVSYSIWWRRLVAIDILAIACGFMLRAVAGGAADNIHLSRAFLVVAGAGAVFIVAGKRYAELGDGSTPPLTRASLRRYSPRGLRLVLGVSAGAATVAYALWALLGPGHGLWHLASIVPLVLWLIRYRMLVHGGAGQSPEELIASDNGMLALSGLWAVLFLVGIYASG
jgi:decaprenyl-phosphate phosphoribosyltransferase